MENNLKLIVFENCREFGEKVDKHLQEIAGTKDSFIIPIDEVRFNNGEGKIVINETVRKKEIFLLSVVNFFLLVKLHLTYVLIKIYILWIL